jgi:hypothetical protein
MHGLPLQGGGCATFYNSNEAVAALVVALYPRFPLHTRDNRYHLQAFRHLYVLAVEPRCIGTHPLFTNFLSRLYRLLHFKIALWPNSEAADWIRVLAETRDVDTNEPVYVPLKISLRSLTAGGAEQTVHRIAPYPQPSLLSMFLRMQTGTVRCGMTFIDSLWLSQLPATQ